MSALDKIRVALGRGDSATALQLAAIAIAASVPAWLVLAIILALGTGK